MKPGEYILQKGEIKANDKRRTVRVTVANTGDRPIQVGSHYHFFETNKALEFDRAAAFGMRLNIPASTAVRFEPGEKKAVFLVEFGGNKLISGFNNLTEGDVTKKNVRDAAIQKAQKEGFKGAGGAAAPAKGRRNRK
ncbi:urease subunit beta [Pontibacter lucknowensis]|uniref:Urease subunit beta n=1 Tax=Pontibacter lucknowensis TaxID=1077936 RepID=A0A1N7A7Z6_9BACT|nr:urease subunit beta [Pontibacter lucknowensis]SIR35166.1 urease subunit beta/urease subunit gamma/beta [Pontibacter lucknowensis]